MAKITARSPATGDVIKEYEEAGAAQARAAMERARAAFGAWKERSTEERAGFLRSFKKAVLDDLDGAVRRIVEATGKTDVEALTSDILPTLDIIQYYEEHAEKILETESRQTSSIFLDSSTVVEYRPMGVVAVFSPWNFPFQLAVVPAVTALAAGNAVILKPSELTPSVGELVETLFAAADLPGHVLQVIQGGAKTGEALIKSGPDKIFFTGSLSTGRKIMEAASRGPIPVELELSGKDPMIVFDDASFERAANAAVYGAFANAGQVCVSVERLYVQRGIYDKFMDAVARKTNELRIGTGKDADVGTVTSLAQLRVIDEHVNDALEKGAEMMTGGSPRGQYVRPVVLKNANHTMKVMTEETFGPVLAAMPFDTEQEAVRLANDSDYGLNASIFTKDLKKAARVASRIETGNCAVNDVVINIGNPHAPFGGVKRSGFGRYHGPEGLRSFTNAVSVMTNPGRLKRQPNWFPYTQGSYDTVKKLMGLLYGEAPHLRRARRLLDILVKLTRTRRRASG